MGIESKKIFYVIIIRKGLQTYCHYQKHDHEPIHTSNSLFESASPHINDEILIRPFQDPMGLATDLALYPRDVEASFPCLLH